jgi:large-conductance mechanosensitive channel
MSYSFVPLLLGAIIGGASDALASGNNDALLYDSLCTTRQTKSYHKIYARITSYYQFALFMGSLIGAVVAFYSMRLAIILNILPLTIALGLSLVVVEPRCKAVPETSFIKQFIAAIKNLWRNRRLRYVATGNGLNYGLNESAYSFNSVFISQFVPVWALGIFKSLGHLLNSFGAHLSNRIARKIGIGRTAGYGLVTDNFMNIVSVLCNSILTPIVRLGSPLAEGVYSPAINTITQNEIPSKIRATTLSIASIFASLCYSGAAVIVGYLADITSPYWALLAAYTMALIMDSLVFIGLKYRR